MIELVGVKNIGVMGDVVPSRRNLHGWITVQGFGGQGYIDSDDFDRVSRGSVYSFLDSRRIRIVLSHHLFPDIFAPQKRRS